MTPSEAIAALRAAGLSESAIAAEVKSRTEFPCAQSSINRIGRGEMQPNYTVGKALVDMAEEMASDSRRGPAAETGDAAEADGNPLHLKDAA